MGGAAALLLIASYIILSVYLIRLALRRGNWQTALLVAIATITLPTVDAVIGRAILVSKCEIEGRFTIRERINNVEGIGVLFISRDAPMYYGYRYVEGNYAYRFETSPHMYERQTRVGNGPEIQTEKNIQPRAKYLLHKTPREDSAYFFKYRVSVNEIKTGRELSGFNWYEFRGGWAERALGELSDAGARPVASCNNIGYAMKGLLHETLRPAL